MCANIEIQRMKRRERDRETERQMRVFYSKFRLGSNSRHQICPKYNNTDTFTRERDNQTDIQTDRKI